MSFFLPEFMEYTEYTVSPTVSLQVACFSHHFHQDTSLVEVWQPPLEPPGMPSKRSGPGSSLEMRDGLPLDLHPSSNTECSCASLQQYDFIQWMNSTSWERLGVCFTLAAIWRSSRSRGFRRCILHLKALKLQPMTDTRCVLIQLSQFRLLSNKWKNMFDALRDAEPIEWSKCTKCAISMSTKLSVSCSTKNFAKLRQAPQTLCPGAIWAAGFGRILFRCGNKVISNCSKRLWDSQM